MVAPMAGGQGTGAPGQSLGGPSTLQSDLHTARQAAADVPNYTNALGSALTSREGILRTLLGAAIGGVAAKGRGALMGAMQGLGGAAQDVQMEQIQRQQALVKSLEDAAEAEDKNRQRVWAAHQSGQGGSFEYADPAAFTDYLMGGMDVPFTVDPATERKRKNTSTQQKEQGDFYLAAMKEATTSMGQRVMFKAATKAYGWNLPTELEEEMLQSFTAGGEPSNQFVLDNFVNGQEFVQKRYMNEPVDWNDLTAYPKTSAGSNSLTMDDRFWAMHGQVGKTRAELQTAAGEGVVVSMEAAALQALDDDERDWYNNRLRRNSEFEYITPEDIAKISGQVEAKTLGIDLMRGGGYSADPAIAEAAKRRKIVGQAQALNDLRRDEADTNTAQTIIQLFRAKEALAEREGRAVTGEDIWAEVQKDLSAKGTVVTDSMKKRAAQFLLKDKQ
jgi:hypothetical protein